jgi:CRP-like cAMP-binding protein
MSFITGAEPLRRFLAKVNSRSRLTPDERDAVLALPCVPRQVQANREIVRLGEQVEHSCLVVDGYVARFALLEDGSRQIVSLHIAGDMVDLYSLMLPAVPTPLVALSLSTIVQIPHSALRTLTFQHPAVAAALWRECVVDGAIVAQWLVNVGRREARGRIGHLFCEPHPGAREPNVANAPQGGALGSVSERGDDPGLGWPCLHQRLRRRISAARELARHHGTIRGAVG